MRLMTTVLLGGTLVMAAASCGGAELTAEGPIGGEVVEVDEAPEPRQDGRLPTGVTPLKYELELTVDPRKADFSGLARIEVEQQAKAKHIVLHGRDLEVQTAAFVTAQGDKSWADAQLRPAAHSRPETNEELVLSFEKEVPAGKGTLEIQYTAPFGAGLRGLYTVVEGGERYAFSQMEPNDARRVLPCFDEPGFKVPLELTLIAPKGMTAVANAPLEQSDEMGTSGLVRHRFRPTPPIPTYLIALAVGPLEVREVQQAPLSIRVVAPRGKAGLGALAGDVAKRQLAVLSDYFGRPYPYQKLDLVAVPDFGAGAMENPGLVTFREELLLVEPKRASARQRERLRGIMAHELAHMWFGNLVTPAWWDDLWLNEAFATWMSATVVDAERERKPAMLHSLVRKYRVMGADQLPSARRVRQAVRSTSDAHEAFDGIIYVKGMAVLRMLEEWLGRERFRAGVRQYIDAHAWKNATGGELLEALEAAARDEPGARAVVESFVLQTGYPRVRVQLECQDGRTRVLLEQSEHRALGQPRRKKPRQWAVPVCVAVPKGTGRERHCRLLQKQRASVDLGERACPAWVLGNAGDSGYYVADVGKDGREALVAHRQALSEAERVGLVLSSWALTRGGELEVGEHLTLLGALVNEDSRAVWQAMLHTAEELERMLGPALAEDALEAWLRSWAAPALDRLGREPKPGDAPGIAVVRSRLFGLLGRLGEPSAVSAGKKLGRQWLKQPDTVDPQLRDAALAILGQHGTGEDVAALERTFKSASGKGRRLAALSGLVQSRDPKRLAALLDWSLNGTLRPGELGYAFHPLFEQSQTRDLVHGWLLAHFDELRQRIPGFGLGRVLGGLRHLCDARARDAARFYRSRTQDLEGMEKHLRRAVEGGSLCAAFRRQQAPQLQEWLQAESKSAGIDAHDAGWRGKAVNEN